MKILSLIVLSLAVSAYGNPVQTSEVDLKLKAKELLEKIEVVKHDISDLAEERKKIQGQVFESGKKIDQYLSENSIVLQTKEALAKGTSNGKNVKECQEVFERVLFWTSRSLKQNYYDSAEPDLQGLDLSLLIWSAQIDQMKQDLDQNLDKIVKQCVAKSAECKITTDFSDTYEEVSGTIQSIKPLLPQLINTALENVKKEIMPNEVKYRFGEVEECLEKMQ